MTTHHPMLGLPGLTLFCAAGLLLGWGYFALLRRWVALHLSRGASLGSVAAALGRITAAGTFFVLTARCGVAALLAAFLGFLLARTLALRTRRVQS